MSRALAWLGAVALVFGLAAGAATGPELPFARLHVGFGGAALALSAALAVRRLGALAGPPVRYGLAPAALRVLLVMAAALAVERAAALSGLGFDWSPERRYAPDPALVARLDGLCGPVEMLHFGEAGDPRLGRTRLWLETLARHESLSLRALDLAEAPAEAHRYGIGSSNRLVLRRSGQPRRFERVESPGEGALYEALGRLCSDPDGLLLWLVGEGQGDPASRAPRGYSGLAAALEAEGQAWRRVASAALERVPAEATGVLVVAPERPLHPRGVAALERYLVGGGRLVALIEPGTDSGLEALLARWGIESPPVRVLDPPERALGVEAEGEALVVQHWETHPISAGLGAGRAGYLPGARSFALRKPRPDDRLDAVAWSGPQARLAGEPGGDGRYLPLAVAGRYPRDESAGETRIFAVGDADFASNRHLRSVYNLDLALNGVHWALARESAIALRPKLRDTVQVPLPTSDALRSFYGLGLLLPEALLALGGLVWLRRRQA